MHLPQDRGLPEKLYGLVWRRGRLPAAYLPRPMVIALPPAYLQFLIHRLYPRVRPLSDLRNDEVRLHHVATLLDFLGRSVFVVGSGFALWTVAWFPFRSSGPSDT